MHETLFESLYRLLNGPDVDGARHGDRVGHTVGQCDVNDVGALGGRLRGRVGERAGKNGAWHGVLLMMTHARCDEEAYRMTGTCRKTCPRAQPAREARIGRLQVWMLDQKYT